MAARRTPDQLREQAQALRAELREKGTSLAGPQVRALKKRIRRLQRRRRKLLGAGGAPPSGAAEQKQAG